MTIKRMLLAALRVVVRRKHECRYEITATNYMREPRLVHKQILVVDYTSVMLVCKGCSRFVVRTVDGLWSQDHLQVRPSPRELVEDLIRGPK